MHFFASLAAAAPCFAYFYVFFCKKSYVFIIISLDKASELMYVANDCE